MIRGSQPDPPHTLSLTHTQIRAPNPLRSRPQPAPSSSAPPRNLPGTSPSSPLLAGLHWRNSAPHYDARHWGPSSLSRLSTESATRMPLLGKAPSRFGFRYPSLNGPNPPIEPGGPAHPGRPAIIQRVVSGHAAATQTSRHPRPDRANAGNSHRSRRHLITAASGPGKHEITAMRGHGNSWSRPRTRNQGKTVTATRNPRNAWSL